MISPIDHFHETASPRAQSSWACFPVDAQPVYESKQLSMLEVGHSISLCGIFVQSLGRFILDDVILIFCNPISNYVSTCHVMEAKSHLVDFTCDG